MVSFISQVARRSSDPSSNNGREDDLPNSVTNGRSQPHLTWLSPPLVVTGRMAPHNGDPEHRGLPSGPADEAFQRTTGPRICRHRELQPVEMTLDLAVAPRSGIPARTAAGSLRNPAAIEVPS